MQVSCTNNFASAPKYSARMRARPSDDDDFSNEGSGGGSSGSGRFRNFMSLARHNNNKAAIVKDKDRQSSTSSTLTTAGINITAGSPSSPGRLAARRSPLPQLVASTYITAAAAAPPPPNKSSSRRSNNNTRSTDRDGFEENPRIPSSPSGTPPKKIWEGAYSKFLRGNSAKSGASSGGSSGVSGGGGVSGKPPMAISPKSSPSSSPPNITATTTTGNMGNGKKSSSFSILPGTKRLVTLSRNGISNHGMALNGANQYATAAVDALDGHSHGGISAPTVPQFPCSRVALNASSGATENGDAGVGNQENPEGEVSVRGGKLFQSVFSRSNNDLARQQSVGSSISRFPTSHRSHQSMDALDVPMRKGVEKTSSASPDIRRSFRKQAEKRVQHQVDSSISSALAASAPPPPVPAANAYSFSTPVSTLGTTTSREEDDNGDPAKGSETPKSLDDLLASAASTPDCQHLTVTFGNVTGATAATRSVSMGGLIHPMINEGVRLSPSATSSGMLQPRIQGRYSFNNLQLNIPEGGEVKDIPPPPHQINPVFSGGNSFSRIPSSPVQQVGLALDDSDNASNSTEDVQSTPLSHVDRPVDVLESSGNLDQILADASRAQTPPPSRPHSEKKKAFTNFHNASRFANDSTSPFLGAEDDSSNQGDRDQDSYMSYHSMLMQKRRPDHQHSVGGLLSERGTTHTFHHRLNMPHLVSASLPLDTVDEQNISILKGMRLLKPIQGTESWQQGRRYLITPAVLSACSLPAINKLAGSTILPASVAADSSSAFGMINLGEALMTYVGEKHHLSLGKWSSCRLVLRQNYLFEYDIDTPLTGSPRGFCHLQHAIAYPHQDFQDALELQFYASPCAKADQRVLMIRIQKAMTERQQQEEERNNWITCLNDAAQLRIQDLWHFDTGNVFGTGRYASVHPARRKTRQFFQDETGTTKKEEDNGDYDCALKIVDKNEFWRRVVKGRERADTLVRELSVQSTLTSKCGRIPTFSQVRGVFESSDNFVIELELLQGEDLFEYISSKGVLGEDEAALVLYDVLTALEAMSRIGVSHRDVKPANVLLANSEDNELSVKLGDFGMSTFVGVDGLVRGRCGTPGYVAPEILTAATRSGYSGLCDVFSAGVTLYVMLSGYEPFYGETEKELIEANRLAIVEFPDCDWGSISPQARDLLDQMLSSDPTKRITAKDALQHEWILKHVSERKKKLSSSTSGAFHD